MHCPACRHPLGELPHLCQHPEASMRPTDRIVSALAQELEDRRPQIDAGKGLRSIRLHVRLSNGGEVTSVEYSEVSERHLTAVKPC